MENQAYILDINDSEDYLRLAEKWLRDAGFEVETATTGQQGCVLCGKRKPDLILLDYHLKKDLKQGGLGWKTGIDFVPEFRKACPGVPIVVMSATVVEKDIPLDERALVDGFIYANGKFEWATLPDLVKAELAKSASAVTTAQH
jgi:CheY-like chemotaxis protein